MKSRPGIIFLLVLSISLIPLHLSPAISSSVGFVEVYINESNFIQHSPLDPVYASIADNSVIIRISVNRSISVDKIFVVIYDNEEIPLKPQLYLTENVMWYTRIAVNKQLRYYFKLELVNGTIIHAYNSRAQRLFELTPISLVSQVTWIASSVGYEIFPDRFYNGDPSNDQYALIYDSLLYDNTTSARPLLSRWNDPPHNPLHCCHQYFGGDLKGIIAKLDYLKELNISLIYLTPIFLCGSAHCYDTYDHYTVHPRLGTLDDLRKLLDEAHKRGIKVIFDFVPGHVGLGFWAFQDAYVNGPNSKYWNWFTIYQYPFTPGNGKHYRCWWGFGSLPQLNTTNPEVKEYLINVVLYWLGFGFDGVRIDTPLDLLNPREFFNELRTRVKSRYPGAYIVGEIWELRPEWVNNGPFDSLMNYALGNLLVSYVKDEIIGDPGQALSYYYSRYSVAAAGMGFNIIGSHDTDRVLTMLGGGRLFAQSGPPRDAILRLKMLSTLQYTQPGAPIVFQGDERGIPGIKLYPYEEHRYPIQWDRLNQEVFEHYKRLGLIKSSISALHTSIIRVFETPRGILAYTRGYNDEILVLANSKNESMIYHLPAELSGKKWKLIYSSSGLEPDINENEVRIPPLTALILSSELTSTISERSIFENQFAVLTVIIVVLIISALTIYYLKRK